MLRILQALIALYGKTIDAILLRSQNPDQENFFCGRGFSAAPSTPDGWFLDKANLLPTHDWYPVPADGDGLI